LLCAATAANSTKQGLTIIKTAYLKKLQFCLSLTVMFTYIAGLWSLKNEKSLIFMQN